MITIEHGIGHVAVYNGKPEDVYYNAGILPADYPMPAIPLRTMINAYCVVIIESEIFFHIYNKS